MRSWGIVAGALFFVAIAFSLGRIAWPVDPGHVAADFAVALGPLESPVVDAPIAASLTWLPRPTLHMDRLNIRAADGAFSARAASADAVLRFDRLLVGQFAVASLTLQEADVRVDLDAARSAIRNLARRTLPRLALQGGAVTLASARQSWATRFDVASARIDWASPGSTFRLSATGRWREQPVEVSAEIYSPLAAARGAPSGLRLSLESPLARLKYSGDASYDGQLEGGRAYLGEISALVPSLDRFSRWIGQTREPWPGGLELEARASGDAERLGLSDARVVLGGQAFEGALDLAKTAEGVAASGTLAAEKLDLEPLIGPPPALFDAAGEWSKTAVLPAASRRLDLDLRVSATHAVWGEYALDGAAGAVSQRAGRLAVKLLEASFAHGSLSAEVSVENSAGGCESRVALSLENADFGGLLGDFGQSNFEGHGTLKAAVRARGRTPGEIVATANGEGSLELDDGALLSLNFEEALRRSQRRPLDVARDMNAGPTRFALARGRFAISDGEARFVDAETRAPGVSLALTGAIDVKNRVWRALVQARQSALDGEPTPDGAHIDFTVAGPWAAPTLAPVLQPAD